MTAIYEPVVLHLGDPIKFDQAYCDAEFTGFKVIRPTTEERQRDEFKRALKERRWGDFHALFRPHVFTGTEMGVWDGELISLLPSSVRVFASALAGFDTVDVATLAKRGIVYCNSAGAGSEAVSDMAIFHILSCFRNLTWSHLAARSGDSQKWLEAFQYVPDTAHNPRGFTLGVVGLGSIGFLTAKKMHVAFGMKIVYHDVARKPEEQEQEIRATFYDKLTDMLAISDCVLIATPYDGRTLIDTTSLAHFKRGSRLVNIARGGLVDEEALADALESGQLSAAGLDVYQNEPEINKRLLLLDKCTSLTCHNGGDAHETHVNFERLCVDNVKCVLTGRRPLTPVNLQWIPASGV